MEISLTIVRMCACVMVFKKQGEFFQDDSGRTRLLRGVNLGGSSKIPTKPNGATYLHEGFFDHRHVSFIGRPFPLEQADEHFSRLKAWGLTFIRLLVPWEAVEHAGPGIYDEAYLDYLEAIIQKAGEYEMVIFIDPHQDVWSRFSGGDGAPGWTLEAVGFEMRNFKETGAAVVHQTYGNAPFPKMIWSTNYSKLASATMFTLFFGGNDFAPHLKIEGIPVQEFLQGHFIATMQKVMARVAKYPHVIGIDSLNEPSRGFIGLQDLGRIEWTLRMNDTPTPFESMALGAGYPRDVQVWLFDLIGQHHATTRRINTERVRAWQDGHDCIWREAGVWDVDNKGNPYLSNPKYFALMHGKPVDFARDYLRPFINRFAKAIHEIAPEMLIFIEFDAVMRDPIPQWTTDDAPNIVFAPHWYDFLTLMSKRYFAYLGIDAMRMRPVAGKKQVLASHVRNLAHYKQMSKERLGNVPVVIGEIGIPYDLNGKQAYWTGDWKEQIAAIDDYMHALESNLLNATIWNYTADNNNVHGDLWNDEDLSIYSPDQRKNPADINSGGRALEALVRPYAMAIAGRPLRMSFNAQDGHFHFAFRHDSSITAPTEIFVPNLQYPHGCTIQVSDGHYDYQPDHQRLFYWHSDKDIPHTITIQSLVTPPRPDGRDWVRYLWVLIGIVLTMRFMRQRDE